MFENRIGVSSEKRNLLIKCLSISILVIIFDFLWEGHKGFNLSDEGYLWYGVQQVLRGGVPLRDFMSYDPGRYYWGAFFALLSDNSSIINLRFSVAVFQWLGLFAALWLIGGGVFKSSNPGKVWFLVPAAFLLMLWEYPYYKDFDITISIIQVWVLAYWLARPSDRQYLFSGVALGGMAVFGRNHGVYGLFSALEACVWLGIEQGINRSFLKRLCLWGGGVVLGFTPIILMILFVPGFGQAFWESVRFLFESKTTNLAIPVPWPWTVHFARPYMGMVSQFSLGILFILFPASTALAFLWLMKRRFAQVKVRPEFVAAVFVAIPYIHYSYSRADIEHLAFGLSPWLIGALCLLACMRRKPRRAGMVCLFAISLVTVFRVHAGWECHSNHHCVEVEISGNRLRVNRGVAGAIALIDRWDDEYADRTKDFFMSGWPTAYAMLGRKSPTWEIYALFPQSRQFEEKEIKRIERAKPAFVFIDDSPLDGRDDRKFSRTHPLMEKYIEDNFDKVPSFGEGDRKDMNIYKAREGLN